MKKIFLSHQIRSIDSYTITNEPVNPFDLMERAAAALTERIEALTGKDDTFLIVAGTGNNGGDGIAIARLLKERGYSVDLLVAEISSGRSDEWRRNWDLFKGRYGDYLTVAAPGHELTAPSGYTVIVDALLGSGVRGEPSPFAAEVIGMINGAGGAKVISVDVPSGLPGETGSSSSAPVAVRAWHTVAIGFPRLSFMFPENHAFTGEWSVVSIGLHPDAVLETPTQWCYLEGRQMAGMIKRRARFDHKGIYGHLLLAAGSVGKIGASVLASRSALRSGCGLVTAHIPSSGQSVLHAAIPEAMIIPDQSADLISDIPAPGVFDAIAFGPGAGTSPATARAFHTLLSRSESPMVIDADGINLLSSNREWFELLPRGSVLTPHPGEFSRLAGYFANSYDTIEAQKQISASLDVVIVLKGGYTSVSLPDGTVCFNIKGNPGMATAGSGDVLTGIIGSLLAQGYEGDRAALLGVYLHAVAGDIAAEERGVQSLIASDITENIGAAYRKIAQEAL